ncbi:MAG: hypothetical protein ACOCQ0_02565 [Desulfosalsimonas sp.]
MLPKIRDYICLALFTAGLLRPPRIHQLPFEKAAKSFGSAAFR